MENDIILKVEKLSKQYRLGTVGTGTISHDLNRFFAKIRGKEDPYLKIGESNDRASKGNSDYVWALKNINFEVKRGEVLGIIGKNGAGKSTLLKILSKITFPTEGTIKSKGRIASLLEVGTGFHPEMTGKENIFLNGAILGMTKNEINSKLEEIISFSGCQRYIDTPVKRYSSGMKVRLAFAVAAHLEPDILVVDEVLAVGDAEFQKKAIGKMRDISGSKGRTVLFVSHNMSAVKSLCNRAIIIENGKVIYSDSSERAIDFYLNRKENISKLISIKEGKNKVFVESIRFECDEKNQLITGKPARIIFNLKEKLRFLRLDFKINTLMGSRVCWLSTATNKKIDTSNKSKIIFHFDKFPLNKGRFVLSFNLSNGSEILQDEQDYIFIDVNEGIYYDSSIIISKKHAPILLDYNVYSE